MNRKILKASALSAFALTLVMWGCESLSESALVGPGETSEILLVERDSSGFTIARETDPAVGVVTAVIDQNGGSLNIGNHVLTVPAGAVIHPTTFVMTKLVNDIEVSLTATRLLPNDIGRQGFKVPVRLSFSYASAQGISSDPASLKVVWVRPSGRLEVQPTTVDLSAKKVVGSLSHFSQYALAEPRDEAAVEF